MLNPPSTAALESALNDFDPQVRRDALAELARGVLPTATATPAVNLHCHTFFSFNAYGH